MGTKSNANGDILVTFRRVVVTQRRFTNMTEKEIRSLIDEYGAHEMALDSQITVSDTTKITKMERETT